MSSSPGCPVSGWWLQPHCGGTGLYLNHSSPPAPSKYAPSGVSTPHASSRCHAGLTTWKHRHIQLAQWIRGGSTRIWNCFVFTSNSMILRPQSCTPLSPRQMWMCWLSVPSMASSLSLSSCSSDKLREDEEADEAEEEDSSTFLFTCSVFLIAWSFFTTSFLTSAFLSASFLISNLRLSSSCLLASSSAAACCCCWIIISWYCCCCSAACCISICSCWATVSRQQ